jgi:hypothetical protein
MTKREHVLRDRNVYINVLLFLYLNVHTRTGGFSVESRIGIG